MSSCTLTNTGKKYVQQLVGQCFECFSDSSHAICIHCINRCHKNHNVTNVRVANAFCDCPSKCNCLCYTKTNELTRLSDSKLSNLFLDLGLNILGLSSKITISPYSIFTCLSLVQFGCKGKTLDEFKNIMHYEKSEILPNISKLNMTINEHSCCKTCNFIFSQTPLKKSYTSQIKNLATISDGIDIDKINNIVDEITNHLIPHAISEDMINENSVVILMNVIYFKCNWLQQFDKKYTKTGKFNSIRDGEFMNQYGSQFMYTEDYQNQVLEMTYNDMDFHFGIILPKHEGLPKVNSEIITNYINQLQLQEIGTLKIPKFKYKVKFSLKTILQNLGLKTMFDKNKADLSDMTEIERVYVSNVFHELVIIVDEEGTEASSITSCVCDSFGLDDRRHTIDFIADHSFTYYIRYNDVILFMGNFV
jgi:serpin B